MRRSLAPSQIQKRLNGNTTELPSTRKKSRINDQNDQNLTDYRKPLIEIDNYISDHEAIMKQLCSPFKCPIPNYVSCNSRKNLGMRRVQPPRPLYDPDTPNALILYEPPPQTCQQKLKGNSPKLVHVVVDPLLGNILRPHQREGVKFMYECVTGTRIPNSYGCIMADEMGLGKTLQCITLLWTLIRQGPDCKPIINKAIIVCPSSLVKNWNNEINKWLPNRLPALPIDGAQDVKTKLTQFIQGQGRTSIAVLIISYETLRMHIEILITRDIGLMICDEGHRLKNSENQTYRALISINAKRKIILSGTPIQNDLLEYYALIKFINNNLFNNSTEFRKYYEQPIIKGQDSDANLNDRKIAEERLQELATIVNRCVIRRTSILLTKYLPIKFEMIITIQLTTKQKDIYQNFINSEQIKSSINLNKKSTNTLAAITTLKKICNHPDLIKTNSAKFQPELSSKFMLLDLFLANLKANYNDKIVLVSNYTQTLDLFELLFKKRYYSYIRLDGSMSIKKRAKSVDLFNNSNSSEFIFILSSKAGGCGLNLIGANRLIMFDPDWNPANDDQAMARVWRDGQTKPCYIYRFLAAGTIEEKIFQRQTRKKALSSTVVDNNDECGRHFTTAELRDLFKLEECDSDTHQRLKCKRCINRIQTKNPPDSADCTSDLTDWYHCWNKKGLADDLLKQIWDVSKYISFVFQQKSACEIAKKIPQKSDDDSDYIEEKEVELLDDD